MTIWQSILSVNSSLKKRKKKSSQNGDIELVFGGRLARWVTTVAMHEFSTGGNHGSEVATDQTYLKSCCLARTCTHTHTCMYMFVAIVQIKTSSIRVHLCSTELEIR